ncbi:MAG: sugar phosphate isomerase/epimerase, partial [Ruminococcaceae bacterium]|nr:sugar phosphate isomerase/epimerase [Oscillospiraceae bacterium]
MKQFKVGLQLYSVRDDMAEDMLGTLKKVKEMGYDCVEFAGYFDHTAEEVKAMLDEVGLECVSVHQVYAPFLEQEQEMIDYLKVLGAKYCAIPWMGLENHKGNEGFEQAIADITKVAKALKENGIQMLYHNHDFEFNKFEDKFLMDWFYESFS